MKRLVEYPLESGDSILVEVDELNPNDGSNRISLTDDVIQKAQYTFESALERVRPVASVIINKLRNLDDPPAEVEVKFGLKMSAAAGAVIAAASVDGNYEITLKWKRESRDEHTT